MSAAWITYIPIVEVSVRDFEPSEALDARFAKVRATFICKQRRAALVFPRRFLSNFAPMRTPGIPFESWQTVTEIALCVTNYWLF